MLTAAHARIPVHHVTVQSIDQRLSVSLDLEVDGRMSLGAAHAKASKLEAAIRDELGHASAGRTRTTYRRDRRTSG
jgi:divalent metal cation (Fe/Co/Zn/Cd) transporter